MYAKTFFCALIIFYSSIYFTQCLTDSTIINSRSKRGLIDIFFNNVLNKPIQTIICSRDTFRCSSGFNCITYELVCNGFADCNDSSDESPEICNKKCPWNYFQCNQGSCISESKRCDGVVDCPDQSDELNCGQKVEDTQTESCRLPNFPINGKWIVAGKAVLRPGDFITHLTAIQFSCNEGFSLRDPDSAIQVCTKDMWLKKNVECVQDNKFIKTCPPVKINENIEIYCDSNGQKTDCNRAEDGSTLHYKCKDFYVDSNDGSEGVLYCNDASWDEELPQCLPQCGQRSTLPKSLRRVRSAPQKFVIGGEDVDPYNKGIFPWHVAVFLWLKNEFTNVCGGSLVSSKIVVSAAHCFERENDILNDPSLYRIGVGKYFRDFNDPRDQQFAQYREITKISVPDNFKGEIYHYLADIAILALKEPVVFTKTVQPVCLDLRGNVVIQPTDTGTIMGWGFTKEDSSPSVNLKEITVPYVDDSTCSSLLPEEFVKKNFNKNEKMCAGYFQESRSVCRGDSGGGLAFKNQEDGKYYLQGIVSTAPKSKTSGGCDKEQFTLFTKVSYYRNWLFNTINEIS